MAGRAFMHTALETSESSIAMQAAKPLVITQGDPAGIGPEIIVKAFRDAPEALRHCFVVGNVATLRRAAQCVADSSGMQVPVARLGSVQDALHAPTRCVPVLELPGLASDVPWGQITEAGGHAAAECVVWAARAALNGEVAAMCTAPLHKEALSLAGVSFPGHTELLQAEAAQFAGTSIAQMPVRMMLANDELRTVLVSIHVSLRDAIESVTASNILQTLRITHQSVGAALQKTVRIGVAGLNPHAGEGGLFGREEIEAIGPAIAQARAEGIDARGPFAPDTVFLRGRGFKEFDVVVAMYHDQGLIPVKYLGVEQGVNVTLGLPFVRTSPDHGTAFDIAGQGIADPASLLAAVAMARQLSK